MSFQHFKEKLDTHYQLWMTRIFSYKQPQNFSWLFDSPQAFSPDYLQLRFFGRTRFERVMNKALSFVPGLWKMVVWNRMANFILHKTASKYVNEMLKQADDTAQFKSKRKQVLTHLADLLFKSHPNIRFSTFTDMYYFLAEFLRETAVFFKLNPDIYADQKAIHNAACMAMYQSIYDEVMALPNALEFCMYLAVRANWIDCVEETSLDLFLQGFREEINELLDKPELIQTQKEVNRYFQVDHVKSFLSTPKRILYETDNGGEIVFDLMVIECLLKQGHSVQIAGKFIPVLNDMTFEETEALLAQETFKHLSIFIDSGYLRCLHTNSRVAGKFIPEISTEYTQAYEWADVAILKGQGNFQTMPMGRWVKKAFRPYLYKKPMVYMMGVKAPFIQACFKSMLGPKKEAPPLQTMLVYFFDSKDSSTYP